MNAHADGTRLVGATFVDVAKARRAFDILMGEGGGGAEELDVAFYGASGEYVVLVAAKTREAEDRAAHVLREHGASVEEARFLRRLPDVRNRLVHGVSSAGRPTETDGEPVAKWAATVLLLLEQRIIEPRDLLALVVASGSHERQAGHRHGDGPNAPSAEDRQPRLAQADAELQDVGQRLEAALRARYPELFDRRGRLRTAALGRRVAERAGGKKTLSGDDLSALEEAADAKAARSAHAP